MKRIQSLRKLDLILIAISVASMVAVLMSLILQAMIKPEEFSNTGFILYYLKAGGIATVSFSMIIIGLSKIRSKESLAFSTICFALGLLFCLGNGVGGIYKNKVFRDFLEEKNRVIDKIGELSDVSSDEFCKHSLTLARSIYYLRGEITAYSTCDGVTSSFVPTDTDVSQRNHVIFVEMSASRARDTGILFFTVLFVATIIGLTIPSSQKRENN